uniref:VP11 n=1 Tax=viral metagenome TaxID=1070528 RepID=A0A2V0RIP3_9ZZZZ
MNPILREIPIFHNKVDIISKLKKWNPTDPLPAHTRYLTDLLSGKDTYEAVRSGSGVVDKARLAFGVINYIPGEQSHFTVELAGRIAPTNGELGIELGYDERLGISQENSVEHPNYGASNTLYEGSNLILRPYEPAASVFLVRNNFNSASDSELVVVHRKEGPHSIRDASRLPRLPPVLTSSENIPISFDFDTQDKTELLIIGPPFDYRGGKSPYQQRRPFIAYSPQTTKSEYTQIVRDLPEGRSTNWLELEFDSSIRGEDTVVEVF